MMPTRWIHPRTVLAVAPFLLAALGACDGTSTSVDLTPTAIVDVKFSSPDTMRILITKIDAIAEVERFLRERTPDRVIPFGYVVRGKGVDPRYEFHYLPESVMFAQGGIEACQYPVTLMRTAEQLDVFFQRRDTVQWCPAAVPLAITNLR